MPICPRVNNASETVNKPPGIRPKQPNLINMKNMLPNQVTLSGSFIRHFHGTCSLQYNQYFVLRELVDQNRARLLPYVVVDPTDPEGILYLSEREYFELLKVSVSNDRNLIVLQRPGKVSMVSSKDSGESPLHMTPDVIRTLPVESQRAIENVIRSELAKLTAGKALGGVEKPKTSTPDTLPVEPKKTNPPISESKYSKLCRMLRREHHSMTHFGGATRFSSAESPFSSKTRFPAGRTGILLGEGNFSKLFHGWGSTLRHWGGIPRTFATVYAFRSCSSYFYKIFKHQGVNTMCLALKVSVFVINNYLAGVKRTNTERLGYRMKLVNGLPSFLPLRFRCAIRDRSAPTIRVVIAFLNIYKAIEGSYRPLSEYLAPIESMRFPWGKQVDAFSSFVRTELFSSILPGLLSVPIEQVSSKPPLLTTAGPNDSTAVLAAHTDWMAWEKQAYPWLLEFSKHMGYNSILQLYQYVGLVGRNCLPLPLHKGQRVPPLKLGKISLKFEPAGKLRPFAIVDFWTQWALTPLHQTIFNMLRLIPTDATFDQTGKTEMFAQRLHSQSIRDVYSYDLKAATDTIPILLYKVLFSYLFGPKTTSLWLGLLTDRSFYLPTNKAYRIPGKEFIRYTRGQPMGARSSWGAMALLHHALVQYAAYRTGHKGFFSWYLVLGDDIVIATTAVAESYLEVCNEFGVKVGLPKSFISHEGFFNFASKSFQSEPGKTGPTNLSPISLREERSVRTSPQRAELVRRMDWIGWIKAALVPRVLGMVKLQLPLEGWYYIQPALRWDRWHSLLISAVRSILVPDPEKLSGLGIRCPVTVVWADLLFVSTNEGTALTVTKTISNWSDPEHKGLSPTLMKPGFDLIRDFLIKDIIKLLKNSRFDLVCLSYLVRVFPPSHLYLRAFLSPPAQKLFLFVKGLIDTIYCSILGVNRVLTNEEIQTNLYPPNLAKLYTEFRAKLVIDPEMLGLMWDVVVKVRHVGLKRADVIPSKIGSQFNPGTGRVQALSWFFETPKPDKGPLISDDKVYREGSLIPDPPKILPERDELVASQKVLRKIVDDTLPMAKHWKILLRNVPVEELLRLRLEFPEFPRYSALNAFFREISSVEQAQRRSEARKNRFWLELERTLRSSALAKVQEKNPSLQRESGTPWN